MHFRFHCRTSGKLHGGQNNQSNFKNRKDRGANRINACTQKYSRSCKCISLPYWKLTASNCNQDFVWKALSCLNCSSGPGYEEKSGITGWANIVRHDSFWMALFFFTFTKQFVSVRWSNFPLTMCYETEKNKSESIEPVLMYNLQGQHLAANIKIFFSAGCIIEQFSCK